MAWGDEAAPLLELADDEAVPLLELREIAMHFGGVAALRGVDFDLRAGEIHALLGENGAGKSTLIKVLGGIHVPDSGSIVIADVPAPIRSVADADRYGIRIIHQEFSLAPNLSIAENIFLGREPSVLGFVRRRRMIADAQALIDDLGLDELPDAAVPVSELTIAQRQLVEIARALSCQARVLVLDEPTSALSVHETEALFVTLGRLRSQGVGIIYISHRLEEVLRLADRITVLRDGQSMGTQDRSQVDQRQLVRRMAGREIAAHASRPHSQPGAVALEVSHLSNADVHDVSFELRSGEVLGLAGLVGSGRSEIARSIFGIDRFHGGDIRIGGEPLKLRGPRDALEAGIVLVPEDRQREGLVMTQSVAFNLALPWVREWMRPGLPNGKRRREIVERAVREFAIRVADVDLRVDALSGGNQQKVLVGRWMERRPKVLILDEPTRGVDVGARAEMFGIVSGLVEAGMAVLLISSDLSEVMAIAHRVALVRDGRIVRTSDADAITLDEVVAVLTGAQTDEARD